MSPRTRGNRQGSVRKVGRVWYLRYVDRAGNRVEKSTDATSKTEAVQLVNREIERVWGRRGAVKTTLVKDLLPLVEADYRHRGQDVYYVTKRWAHLAAPFATQRAAEITTAGLSEYVKERLKTAKPSTVQQELALLRRMLKLGAAATPPIVDGIPVFPTLRCDNVRRDFFEDPDYRRVLAELSEPLRVLSTVAYWMGWRKGELLGLTWAQVDLTTGRVRLYPGSTKNREGRLAVLPAPALDALRQWREKTKALEIETGRIVQHVFHRNGRQIRSYYRAWRKACARAGLAGRWFHDFRRSGVRGWVRDGVSEPVAMRITGHKTRSVFDRYNIVSEGDLEEAARKRSVSPALPQRAAKRGRK